MKFIIEHLSKRFEQKEVLKDIDFTFEDRFPVRIPSEWF